VAIGPLKTAYCHLPFSNRELNKVLVGTMEATAEGKSTLLLMGASLGTANRGVSALGASLVHLIKQNQPEAAVAMLLSHRRPETFMLRSNSRQLTVPVFNYRLSPGAGFQQNLFVWLALACLYRMIPVAGWRAWLCRRHSLIRVCAGARLVGDIRGGDSFSDIYGLGNFLMGSLGVLAVLLVRQDIVLFPQTYGPYKSFLARCVARFILRRALVILSRDRESLETLRGLIGDSDRIRFCPDVAFTLEARLPARLQIEPPLPRTRSGCLVGLNVNGLMFNGGYTRANMFGLKLDYPTFLKRLLLRLINDAETRVLLVPHTFAAPGRAESDPEASRIVMNTVPEALAERVHLVTAEYDQSEIKGVIGLCDFFIGSRMHACIAALSQGIPAVGVAYSKKFAGVFETVGAGDWVVDGRTMGDEEALIRTMNLFQRREEIRPELMKRVWEAQNQLQTVFRELFSARTGVLHQEATVAAATPDAVQV
jgi:polysaccharide pyruvyl transferase WcaK-like protein